MHKIQLKSHPFMHIFFFLLYIKKG